jgi:hypothetical protein
VHHLGAPVAVLVAIVLFVALRQRRNDMRLIAPLRSPVG